MIEQIKRINNPLTIIAIFAALAEVNATIAIGLIDKNLHYIFIWFIICFPSLLVILFFLTLNYNTKVMYSPSDYREDKTFLDSLYGQVGKNITRNSINYEIFSKSLASFEKKIITSIEEKVNLKSTKTFSGDEIKELLETYKSELKSFSAQAINESTGINFEIPPQLKSAIVTWISFPAFIPIIYAIVKESSKSVQALEIVEQKYNLPIEWDKGGIGQLLSSQILLGNRDNFDINIELKDSLVKWLQLNEHIILQVINVFADVTEKNRTETSDKARNITQRLII